MTSEWELIEQTLHRVAVPLRLSAAELFLVREAREGSLDLQLAEGRSAWQVLAEAAMTAAVKGLTPAEAELAKKHPAAKGAVVRPGNTGMVMALPPREWLRIKQEIEASPEHYEMLGGGVADPAKLAQKIGSALELVMGKGPALSRSSAPSALGPDQDPVVPGLAHGSDQYRMDEPVPPAPPSPLPPSLAPSRPAVSPSDRASRAARVAAQDMAMMGAKSKRDLGRVTKSGRVSVSDAYDRMEEDMTAEGIGKWARSAMAAGALGMAGGAMGADQPSHAPGPSGEPEITHTAARVRPERPPMSTRGGKQIDYQQPGWEADRYDPTDPMAGMRPENPKLPRNEDTECPEDGMEEEGY